MKRRLPWLSHPQLALMTQLSKPFKNFQKLSKQAYCSSFTLFPSQFFFPNYSHVYLLCLSSITHTSWVFTAKISQCSLCVGFFFVFSPLNCQTECLNSAFPESRHGWPFRLRQLQGVLVWPQVHPIRRQPVLHPVLRQPFLKHLRRV